MKEQDGHISRDFVLDSFISLSFPDSGAKQSFFANPCGA